MIFITEIMMKKIFIILLTLGIFTDLNAEPNTVNGVVYGIDAEGKKDILPKATLFWMGTKKGTLADREGKFSIPKPDNSNNLIVSYTGYMKDTISISSTVDNIEVVLESSYSTDEVVVTANETATLINFNDDIRTDRIGGHGLRKAACCNLAESFETNPSVDVSYSDAVTGAKQIELLGLAGIYSQMLTEKIPLMRGLANTFGLNYVPGSWMESIAISKGAASVATGYESITGQISVDYKKPNTGEPLFINLFANDAARLEANLNSSIKVSENLGTAIFAHVSQMQTEIDHNDDTFLDMPTTRQINFMNRWTYDHSLGHTQFGVKALSEERRGGQKGYFGSDNNDLYGMEINTRRYEAFGKSGFFVGDHSSLALLFSASRHEQDAFFGSNNYKADENSFYLNLLFDTEFGYMCEHDHNSHEGHDHAEESEEHEDHEGHDHAEETEEHDTHEGHDHAEEAEEHDDHEGHGHVEEHDHNSHEGHGHAEEHDHEEGLPNCVKHVGHWVSDHKLNTGISFLFDEYIEELNGQSMYRNEIVPGAFAEYTFTGIDKLTVITGLRTDFHNNFGTFVTPRFHLKYQFDDYNVIRASAGKGYRVPNVYAENINLLASSREIFFEEDLDAEEAWNFGVNASTEVNIFDLPVNFNAEFYHTNFINQMIIDLDRSPGETHIYNLDGDSYSNAFQVDMNLEPIYGLEITAAYRWVDVKMTLNGKLEEKPLQSRNKSFINIGYTTDDDSWAFDFTANRIGSGRLPNTSQNPVEYRLPDEFDAYFLFMGQITKKFKDFEIYVGGENLGDYTQKNPILAWQEPFGKYFDSSIIWAPVMGRKVYAGIRLTLFND